MSKVLLNPHNRILLKFQRKNLIETTSSSSDSDNHQYDTVKLLDSKKGLVKLAAILKVLKSLKYFESYKLENQDKILL